MGHGDWQMLEQIYDWKDSARRAYQPKRATRIPGWHERQEDFAI
jgi:hypothetical protein